MRGGDDGGKKKVVVVVLKEWGVIHFLIIPFILLVLL
jgi:hypothetical protein